jgi:hypothetical protein
MTGPDRLRVATEVRATAGLLGQRPSEDVATAYVRALDDLDADRVIHVLRQLARTAESGAHLPTPVELRRRCGGAAAPNAPLSPAAIDRVQQRLWGALAQWERTKGPTGSARPTFERVWLEARRAEGGGGTVLQREQLWQQWLTASPDQED